tara:strand:+ start:811 stop:1038 length:228 start_codon:yes stop_codon:yes gene_type:complete
VGKKQQESIWKFNDEEWKVHITNEQLKEEVLKNFNLRNSTTTYYESGTFQEETSWDLIVPNKLITKVKKYIKDNS